MKPLIELGRRLVAQVEADDVIGLSAELAYRFFLALFPFAVFLSSLGGFVASRLNVENPANVLVEQVAAALPSEAAAVVEGEVRNVIEQRDGGLLSFGALAALFFATGGTNAMIKAMNRAFGVREARPFWRRYLLALGMTVLAGISLSVALIIFVGGQIVGETAASSLGLEEAYAALFAFGRWPVTAGLLLVSVAILYRLGPNMKVPLRWILPGAVLFTIGWLVATFVFGLYVSDFGRYGATYGALAGVAILLIWFYLTAFVLLLGVELNDVLAEMNEPDEVERRRAEGGEVDGQPRRQKHLVEGAPASGRPISSAGRRGRQPFRTLSLLLVLAGVAILARSVAAQDAGDVRVLQLDGMINPVSERYLVRGIDEAERDRSALVLVELDTPGGLLEATQTVTGAMLGSRVPVAVYVTPPGARAASAGTFITMAGHVAAMAPSTRIGAATPVGVEGQDIPADLREKIINDTAVYARSIADAHGRNADWAEDAVRDAAVVAADEAVELGVVDLIAKDRAELLAQIDGRTVTLATGETALRTAGAPVEERPMSAFESLFMAIADPNIALLLLTLGGIGIYFELANPGAFLPGIAGAIFLILAFLSLGTLPLSYGGLALLLLGLVLLGAEIFVASGGLLGIGGVIAFALGALLLVDEQQAPFLEVSRPLIAGLTITVGAFVLVALRGVMQVRRRPAFIGGADLAGRIARARSPQEVYVAGELWRARRAHGEEPLEPGSSVRILERRGLELIVEPAQDSEGEVETEGTNPERS